MWNRGRPGAITRYRPTSSPSRRGGPCPRCATCANCASFWPFSVGEDEIGCSPKLLMYAREGQIGCAGCAGCASGASSDASHGKRAAMLRLVLEVSQGEDLISYLGWRVHQRLEPPSQDGGGDDCYRFAAGGFNRDLEGDGLLVCAAGIGGDLRS